MHAAPSVSGRHPKTFTGSDICAAAKSTTSIISSARANDEDRGLPGRAQLKLLCSGEDEYCADGKWGELIDNSVAFPPAPSRRVARRA
jgi:hypothetical protein